MKVFNQRIKGFLEKRKTDNNYRALMPQNERIDFCSNDYLGIASSPFVYEKYLEKLATHPDQLGASGARLLTGNFAVTQSLESFLADFHRAEAGLLFNSGYTANLGLYSTLARKDDVILFDELAHASMREGIKLSPAQSISFPHNDTQALEKLLKDYKGKAWIAIESVYSMDGDLAPLPEIVYLAKKYEAAILIDEAHATGVVGRGGKGLVNALGLETEIFARVHTFGKAIGTHGAIILGSHDLRNYLINFCKPFIYTTGIPPHQVLSIQVAYEHLILHAEIVDQLQARIQFFKEVAKQKQLAILPSDTAIQHLIIGDNAKAKALANELAQAGFDIKPILAPTVPLGKERLRICLHAFNSEKEIISLCELLHIQNG